MKKLFLFSIMLSFITSCKEDCAVTQSSYVWSDTISGENRRAIIWRSNNECIKSPVLIYLHGRGGDANDSENRRKFHDLLPNSYIVYGEGTNFDNRPDGKFGWETRFPHIHTECGYDKDIKYIEAILNHLGEDERVDISNVGVCGHSSGGFFTLTLAALMPQKFRGFACLGSYSSYIASSSLIDCTNTYVDAINLSVISQYNNSILHNPAPTFFMFGTKENTIKPNSSVYNSDCDEFSYFQNSIIQICKKNGSVLPDCADENFMNTFSRQVFPAADNNSAETQVQMYDDDHSWPSEANQWAADYFADLLYN